MIETQSTMSTGLLVQRQQFLNADNRCQRQRSVAFPTCRHPRYLLDSTPSGSPSRSGRRGNQKTIFPSPRINQRLPSRPFRCPLTTLTELYRASLSIKPRRHMERGGGIAPRSFNSASHPNRSTVIEWVGRRTCLDSWEEIRSLSCRESNVNSTV